MLSLQSQAPHITSLTLKNYYEKYDLPDMTENLAIRSLDLPQFTFEREQEWLVLPSKLAHLSCGCIDVGPWDFPDEAYVLNSLPSLSVEAHRIPLIALSQLLTAAPSLKQLTVGRPGEDETERVFSIACSLTSATAEVLQVVKKRWDLRPIRDGHFKISCEGSAETGSLLPIIAGLPIMEGVSCTFADLQPGQLRSLQRVFPAVQQLSLEFSRDMDDLELQEVATYAGLTKLELIRCHSITAFGILALCQRLPKLSFLSCYDCKRVDVSDLELCLKLLRRHGSKLEKLDRTSFNWKVLGQYLTHGA